MKKNIIFNIALVTFFINGCTPDVIDIDVKPSEPGIVVASKIIPQGFMFVALTKSFSPLEPIASEDTTTSSLLNNYLVSNAFVTVSYSGQIDTLSMLGPGIYISTNTLLTNYNTYTLNVTEPSTGRHASAVTDMPGQVKFDTVYPVVIKNPDDTIISVKYVLKDNPNEENYYVVNYILKQYSNGANLDISSFFNRGSNKILAEFDLLNDASFTNNILTKESTLKNVRSTDSIAVEIANITKGYYEFLTAFKSTESIVAILTSEPIHFPTNVQNGYGYFNAYYPNSKVFHLGQY